MRPYLVVCEACWEPSGPPWKGEGVPQYHQKQCLRLDGGGTTKREVTCGLSLIKPEKDQTPKGWLTIKKGEMSERESGS